MIRTFNCYIYRPDEAAPNVLAVTCTGAERAMVHAERAAREWEDWRLIEVFEGERRVAFRSREEG